MSKTRILHLEDSIVDASTLRQMLDMGSDEVDITWAKNRKEYSEALENQYFDFIFSDSDVTGIPGKDAFELALEKQPRSQFIFVSNHMTESLAGELLDQGALDFISKNSMWKLPHLISKWRQSSPATSTLGTKYLIDVVSQLSSTTTFDEIIEIVRKAAREIIGADGATVILRDGDFCHYVDEDAISALSKGERFPVENCIGGHCMNNKEPIIIEDVFQDERVPIEAYKTTFIKSMAMVPIRKDNPIGALGNYWAQPYSPSPDEIQLLQALADATSAAIDKVNLLNSLEEKVKERTVVLQSLNDELEAFSYTVSHDLKSPLTAIKNNCYLLQRKYAQHLDDKGKECLGWVDSSVQRMRQQLDTMLAMFKVTQVQVKLNNVDLSELAHNIVRNFEEEHSTRDIEIQIEPNLKTFGDENLLHVVLENLIGNAWKYSSKVDGKARIEFGAAEKKEDNYPIYYVKDNGAGFDSEKAERLFQPFQRMHSADEFEGTGVGLSSVQRIIRKHGGRVWAESKPGQGATFFFTIPTEASIDALEDALDARSNLLPNKATPATPDEIDVLIKVSENL